MNLAKSIEFFDPAKVKGSCHIIGCGSVGSSLCENLARLGIKRFDLYDFDKVESHNLANQQFTNADIGRLKVEAARDIIISINPETKSTIRLHKEGYVSQPLSGYVFLCVDNIDLRREICEKNKLNRTIKAVFDFRTLLTSAQHYAANWSDMKSIINLLKTMEFTHEEAHSVAPKTACGMELGVVSTVRDVVTAGVCNFINYIKTGVIVPAAIREPFNLEAYIL